MNPRPPLAGRPACTTCRQRKKGAEQCDKTRPVCRRCVKAGLICGGYAEKGLIWVNRDDSDNGGGKRLSVKAGKSGRPECNAPCRIHQTPPQNVVLHPGLARSAREELYLGAFGSAILPGGRCYSARAAGFGSVGWTGFIPQLVGTEAALKNACLAIGTALVERSSDGQLCAASIQSYNRAVCAVATALERPNWSDRDGLLAATRLMSFYEVLFPPKQGKHMLAWNGHTEGLRAMFLARGPKSFVSGAAHQLYSDSRISMIIISVRERRRCPFSERLWKTIPWSKHEKSAKDRLLDIVEKLPTVLEQLEAYKAVKRGSALLAQIVAQCRHLDEEFSAWEDSMRPDIDMFNYRHHEDLPAPADDGEFALLHLSVIYWLSRMTLHSITHYLGRQAPRELEDEDKCYLKNPPQNYAAACVRALPLYFGEEGGFMESISGMLSLAFAARYFIGIQQNDNHQVDLFERVLNIDIFGSKVGYLLGQLGSKGVKRVGESSYDELSWF